jgi:hypothetical protein
MPCSDGGYSYDQYDTIQRRADEATRSACEAITLLQRQHSELFAELSVETRAWWNRHQREDQARIEREQEEARRQKAKQDAWNKLTDEERKILGVWR